MPIPTDQEIAELEAKIQSGEAPTPEKKEEAKPTTSEGDEGKKSETDPQGEWKPEEGNPKDPNGDGWQKPVDKKSINWQAKYHADVTRMKQEHAKELAQLKWSAPKTDDVDLGQRDEENVKMVTKVAEDIVNKQAPKAPDYELSEDDLTELEAFLEKHPEAADKIDELTYYKKQLPKASFSKLYRNWIAEDDEEAPPAPKKAVTAWHSSWGVIEKKDSWKKGVEEEFSDEQLAASFNRVSGLGK